MKELFIRYLSLSISGLLLALILFALKPFMKNRVSKTWQYYIWIIVIIRLLVPYVPRVEFDAPVQQTESVIAVEEETSSLQKSSIINNEISTIHEITPIIKNTAKIPLKTYVSNYLQAISDIAWLIWIGLALILFTYKTIIYIGYIRNIKTNRVMVTDPEILGLYKNVCYEMGIKARINLYTCNKAASPMLLGFIKPFIVLSNMDMNEIVLRNILTHELIHFKRLDIVYKWAVQITVCLHWFNPIIYRICNEINKSCELSCDEAIIKKLDVDSKRQYGNTLLVSVKTNVKPINTGISLSLSEDAKLLKERLKSIMIFKKTTKVFKVITILLTMVIFLCSTVTNVKVMASIPQTIQENKSEQTMMQPFEAVSATIAAAKPKLHPDNKQFTSIDSNKITTIKLSIKTASVHLKTTEDNTFRLSYTGGTNKSYKASAEVSGKNKEIVTIMINGKPQKITSMEEMTEIDSVTLEIPDNVYHNISIEGEKSNLSICDINAAITVNDKNGNVSLKNSDLKRGSYTLKTDKGIINIDLDALHTQLNVENTNGIININFNEEPMSGEFYLYVIDEQDSVTLPKGWKKYITKKTNDRMGSPCLSINNHSGFIDVSVSPNSKDTSEIMKTAFIINEKYYLIETEEDLRSIGSPPYSLSDNYMLNKNITLEKEWKPIGDEKHPFTGKFEGNGCTISNLTVRDKNAKYIGLFGWVEGGTIHNVTLSNVDIASAGGKGRSIGPIVAIAFDTDISDCYVN